MPSDLPIGTLLDSEDAAPAHLIATRLNRYNFWCGQSGSGRTYALGVALEQVLLHTRLPVVILDPNSDFVHLDTAREGSPAADVQALAERDIRVRRSGAAEGEPLRAAYIGLPLRSRAAILQMDPPLVDAVAPASVLERSPGFAQGQALFGGGFVDQPALVQMGARITREGGSDVEVVLR